MPRFPAVALVGIASLTLTTFSACRSSHPTGGSAFFPRFRSAPPDRRPPTRGLELWLEGESLSSDPRGVVHSWLDMRGLAAGQALAWFRLPEVMTGTAITTTIRTPAGINRTVRALRCTGTPRCSYYLADKSGVTRRDALTNRNYAVFAVAQRAGSRDDQYVLMTEGAGCDMVTGGSCRPNTVLHLGWSGDTTVRLGHYGNDSVLEPVPSFDTGASGLSLLVGQSDSRGKSIALLERLFNGQRLAADTRPLETSGQLVIGGTRWGNDNPSPNWHFEGDIFAVLVYAVELTDNERRAVTDYLRTRYGPA